MENKQAVSGKVSGQRGNPLGAFLVFVLLVLNMILGYLAYPAQGRELVYRMQKQQRQINYKLNEFITDRVQQYYPPAVTPAPSASPCPKITETKTTPTPHPLVLTQGYLLDIRSSSGTADPNDVDLLERNIDAVLGEGGRIYVGTKTIPGRNIGSVSFPPEVLNGKYYFLSKDGIKEGIYETEDVQITVSDPPHPNIEKYLINQKYCQQDSDCEYRTNFCTIGAFNKYHPYVSVWGCGPAEYEDLDGNEIEVKKRLECSGQIGVSYDSVNCVDNLCQVVNLKPLCQ